MRAIPVPSRHILAPLAVIALTVIAARWLSWPGMTTHDSVVLTSEAVSGVYSTHHPLMNALLLRVFAVPFDSYAVYTTLQILLCAAFFTRGVSLATAHRDQRWLPLVSALIWAGSIHTVLYLGIIWKDVLPAYSLLFIASVILYVRIGPDRELTLLDGWLLGLALLFGVTLRHGMWFNLLLVPLFLGLGSVRRKTRLRVPIRFATLGFVLVSFLSVSTLVKDDPAHLLRVKISVVSQPFLGIVSHPNGYTSDDYGYDRSLAARVFGNDYKAAYTADYFRNNVVPSDLAELERGYRDILGRTPKLCALNVSQCISGRIQMMLSTLQPSTKPHGMRFYDLGAMPNCPAIWGMSPEQCQVLDRFETSEKPELAIRSLRWVSSAFANKRSTMANLYAWNLLPALGVLLLVLLLSSPRSPLWLASAFMGAQCALPFATVIANDFRYYYFLALYFAVFAPVAAVHAWVALRKSGREASDKAS